MQSGSSIVHYIHEWLINVCSCRGLAHSMHAAAGTGTSKLPRCFVRVSTWPRSCHTQHRQALCVCLSYTSLSIPPSLSLAVSLPSQVLSNRVASKWRTAVFQDQALPILQMWDIAQCNNLSDVCSLSVFLVLAFLLLSLFCCKKKDFTWLSATNIMCTNGNEAWPHFDHEHKVADRETGSMDGRIGFFRFITVNQNILKGRCHRFVK